jgi:RHS repeat-associated protein
MKGKSEAPRRMTNESGTVVWSATYYPFGEMTAGSSNTHGFTGKEYDSEMDLNYFCQRYYDPQIGRFMTRDLIQQPVYSTYAYCVNNPLRYVDPLGLEGEARPGLRGALVTALGIYLSHNHMAPPIQHMERDAANQLILQVIEIRLAQNYDRDDVTKDNVLSLIQGIDVVEIFQVWQNFSEFDQRIIDAQTNSVLENQLIYLSNRFDAYNSDDFQRDLGPIGTSNQADVDYAKKELMRRIPEARKIEIISSCESKDFPAENTPAMYYNGTLYITSKAQPDVIMWYIAHDSYELYAIGKHNIVHGSASGPAHWMAVLRVDIYWREKYGP